MSSIYIACNAKLLAVARQQRQAAPVRNNSEKGKGRKNVCISFLLAFSLKVEVVVRWILYLGVQTGATAQGHLEQ